MMHEIIELPKNVCEFCKKREATLLCDKVIGVSRWVVPPSDLPLSTDERIVTCSRRICKKCATNIDGMDLCPDCLRKIKEFLSVK